MGHGISGIGILATGVWFASESTVVGLTWRVRRRFTDAASHDGRSAWVVLVGTGVAAAIFARLVTAGGAPVDEWGRALGFGLMFGGIYLRWAAVRTLGRHFSLFVATSPSQPLVTSGPYRVVRHPAYAGVLVTSAGLGLVYGSWWGSVFLAGAAVALFGYRIRVEEAALVSHFGSRYADYCVRTWRLIPWIY